MDTKLKLAGAALAGVLVTAAAGGIAMATVGGPAGIGIGPLEQADTDHDGQLTRAEWLRAANTRFASLDLNKDGKIVWSELPRPPHCRHGPAFGPEEGPPPPADGNAAAPAA